MMYRRDLLKSIVAGCIASAAPSVALSSGPLPWQNWSGNQKCTPAKRFAPKSVEELQAWLRSNQGKMRSVGSGHSFSALVPTNDTMLSMSYLRGVENVANKPTQADIAAGTPLSAIGPALDEKKQALVNMPDVDRQTLAGAISTATHGTGRELQCLSAYVTELELLDPQGDLHVCNQNKNAELFRAAQVGLGSLGFITRIKMQNREPFRLKRDRKSVV